MAIMNLKWVGWIPLVANLRNMVPPPNEYHDKIENVALYAHHRNMFTPPRMFCTNIRIELSISKICVQFNILDSILIFCQTFG